MDSHPDRSIDLWQVLQKLGFAPHELQGKTVLVTGAGRGIGLQAARAFGLLGARIILAEISAETGLQAEKQLCSEGSQALFVQTDVSLPASVDNLSRVFHERFESLDILVNNAIRCPVALLSEMDVELWDQVIAVNLRGTFLTCKAFFPGMLARGRGTIVNMISTDAMPGLSAYIASKQGIAGFSQSLAVEAAGTGVLVVPFAPGMVDTPAIQGIAGKLSPLLGITEDAFLHLSLHPAYACLMPAEHAGAATAYLAARLASDYHGQTVNGYEVLERAGFLPPAQVPGLELHNLEVNEKRTLKEQDLLPLLGKLKQILLETRKEFERLPIFVRPISRSGFKSKSGSSLEEWQALLENLEERPTQISTDEAAAIHARLDKLAGYYQGVPAETARFTRDQEFLTAVAQTSAARIACIRELQEALKPGISG